MIIACPACETRYEVPESSIPPQGRTVRCAKCRHSWFEEGDGEQAEEVAGPPGPDAEPSQVEPAEEVEDAERPTAYFDDTATAPLQGDEDAAAPARGGRLRLWAWAAVIFVVLAGATVAATSAWGLPDWMPVQQSTSHVARSGLRLDFPAEQQERRQLPNGIEFFGASGTITNLDSERQEVPPILGVLRDGRDRIVYSWEVARPKRTLAPGESITVREAITDVPRSAMVAEIGWKPA